MSIVPFLNASLYIQIHTAFAVFMLVLIALIFLMPKGTQLHKLVGRFLAGAMIVVALSSFFIHEINQFYGFSWIHLLSIFTLLGVVDGVISIRKGRVRQHRATMIGVTVGGGLIAGGFTLLPGRLMHQIIFGG